jgi:hypothetical protein
MRAALIGHTGFVGSNLKQQYSFTDFYNSKNFLEMENQKYDLVVCAGVSAVKWLANKEPEKDLSSIKSLESVLATIDAKKFIHISTVDVYPTMNGNDESFDCSSLENHAYGSHRLAFEKFCDKKFADCTIVRLPGLFGDGLKKNVIFDLLNNNCLEMINTKSSYQYYYLKYLWRDIQKSLDNDVELINFFTEPVPTDEIITRFFPLKSVGDKAIPEGHYDLHTKYSSFWNNNGNYIYTKNEVMEQLSEFINDYKV